MPKRSRDQEMEYYQLEPTNKLICGRLHPSIHTQRMHEKTLKLLYSGANKSISHNNNLMEFYSPILQNDIREDTIKKKPLKQMCIGNNLHLYSGGNTEISPSAVDICTVCKIQTSETDVNCSYCESSQCYMCAIFCSICEQPTCNNCSVNNFSSQEGIFCLSCCK